MDGQVVTKVIKAGTALAGVFGIDISPDQTMIICQAAMTIYAIVETVEAIIKKRNSAPKGEGNGA